jgi:aminopeptidase N
VLANPRDVAYGQFVPDAQSRAWLLANLPAEPDLLLRAVASSAMFEAVREAELDPAAFADLCLRLLARETDPDTHGWLLDAFAACTQRYQPAARSAPQRTRAVELLLGQLQATRDSGRELTTLRFLLRTSTDERVLALARTAVRGGTPVPGLELGRQDRFLAAAALLAAGQLGDEYAELERSAAGQDVGKERFLARAAEPTAAAKQRYWDLYLQASEPPEQWIQDSLPFFHWPGQSALTLPFLRPALERVDWVKQNRRIFFMPAWLDGFVNGHGTADALAVVDAFLAEARLGDDVRKKLLQSRDSLARAVRIRATFGG